MWCLIFIYMFFGKCFSQFIYTSTSDVSYQIAGIFERDGVTQMRAFNESMRYGHLESIRLQPVLIQPSRTDSFSVWRELCVNKDMRPIAVIGPQNAITDGAVRDQCAIANIPHIQATWQPYDPYMYTYDTENTTELGTNDKEQQEDEPEKPPFKKITINFYPDSDEISIAYAKLLSYYKWESFAVLYEDNFGLLRVQKILAEYTDKYPITMHRLDPNIDNRNVWKRINANKVDRVLIDCHVDRVFKYMEEAAFFKKLHPYQHYILGTMDASTLSEKLTALPSNFTWLSLAEHDNIEDVKHPLASRVGRWKGEVPDSSAVVTEMKTEALIMDDIANHILKAIDKIEDFKTPDSGICDKNDDTWSLGSLLQQKILETQSDGVTGNIEFDSKGKRINYTLYVNEIHVSNRTTVGRWESSGGGEIFETRSNYESFGNTKTHKEFTIISRQNEPYFMKKKPCIDETCVDEHPEEKYEGFVVDLVRNIFQILKEEKYNYTYKFIDANKPPGTFDTETKKWTGMIGDLLDKNADLAVCDLTITEVRKKVVDFSVPFMTLGISILYTQEHKIAPGWFSFLNPYTVDVWMLTATAYCAVSMILFICARISPADWENPEPCEKDPEELENIWTFKNCTWLTMGSIMTQGCDILPKAIGTRWICGMWWFFAVIVCQTYIAQLSASMTSAAEIVPINSVEDLAQQTKIMYGAMRGGSTVDFFTGSKDKIYQRIGETMKANDALLVGSNDEGEKRVLHGKNRYAFFMESPAIEYKLKRECNLKKVGGELDSKDYGVAMPANSPYRSQINRAILKLRESTTLDVIRKAWWDNPKYGAKPCETKSDKNDVEGDLEMENLIGAFIVLIVGLFFCLIITAVEFLNEVRNIVVREQVSHKEVIIKELKASLNFTQLQKPVLRNPSRAPSVASSINTNGSEKRENREHVIENFLEFEKRD
ncbi:hypothetical protein K1T71_001255 [Dendrolimus kikuchii]|uniref:Uncharacterized protein n=1 Tax=Dendrolimus kikuchii TaxID=765133 RepID=A0ACC1DHQ4_9NEOP|nr:hypothetical protein K1T71_001255 [Dendrolimus kikuchii]